MNRFFTDKQGNPLLLTGLQAHNSSTGTDMLDKAIHAVKLYGGNVLETPIYWYAIEPEKDHYDMSLIRETIDRTRKAGLYLILLWFGTSKNGHPNYVPEYIKLDPATYRPAINDSGSPLVALTPHCAATLERDALAFERVMAFLKEYDGSAAKGLDNYRPRQIEFNRLNLTYTVMSKRKLHTLVDEHFVNGWDDPRMPTLCGMRRRGYSPESIRNFIKSIGYTKFDALNDMALLEAAVREDLNKRATRVSAVLDPVKLVITNYPEDQREEMEAINNPEDATAGSHTITFTRNLWIERADFMEDAPKKFFRMTPGKEVRLKNAYIVKCTGCTKDADGNVVEIQAEYDPLSKSGMEGANRKVKGTLHWVSADACIKAEVREYDRLFNVENPSADERDFRELLNPESLHVYDNCYVEQFAAERKPGEYLQFQRVGYFMADPDGNAEHPVFNKTVGLKDTWAKQMSK